MKESTHLRKVLSRSQNSISGDNAPNRRWSTRSLMKDTCGTGRSSVEDIELGCSEQVVSYIRGGNIRKAKLGSENKT